MGDSASPRGERPTVLLVAEEAAGLQALRLSARLDVPIVAVLTASVHGSERGASVENVARGMGLPVGPPDRVADRAFAEEMAVAGVDLLLNVHSLHVAAPEVIDAPRIGSFNLHPGPLPEYAGLNTPSWAIYNAEPTHGVTLHWMEGQVDSGPVAYATRFEIGESDTGLSVSAACVRLGLPLVERLLVGAREDPSSIPRETQDLSRRRWYGRTPPHDGLVPWWAPAAVILRFLRACNYGPFPSPWGRPRFRCGEAEIGLIRAVTTGRATSAPPGTVGSALAAGREVATGDEWLLVERVAAGVRAVDARDALVEGSRLEGAPPPDQSGHGPQYPWG